MKFVHLFIQTLSTVAVFVTVIGTVAPASATAIEDCLSNPETCKPLGPKGIAKPKDNVQQARTKASPPPSEHPDAADAKRSKPDYEKYIKQHK